MTASARSLRSCTRGIVTAFGRNHRPTSPEDPVIPGNTTISFTRVECGLVTQRTRNSTLEIIRHDRRGHAAEVLEHPHVRAEPVRKLLAEARLGERVVRASEHADEHLRFVLLAGIAIRDPYRLPGIIGEQLVARCVALSQYRLLRRQPVAVSVGPAPRYADRSSPARAKESAAKPIVASHRMTMTRHIPVGGGAAKRNSSPSFVSAK